MEHQREGYNNKKDYIANSLRLISFLDTKKELA